ncbi:cytochrome c biogenesis CcdA family protein [Alicyclobacillus sp. ALC3]|uniref:cytochrome c biogenesis CcdA family protein n=1 Tax=Alicyclobacillus sp. ALC3 TaxID=2796143 RepID=UPI0023796CA3|nr:cytochrome c biogenesis protein CcdA [Alicyclobacillus sp. ALC3]WDL98814.1 hypothetical protein JC200_09255 [Alicyclobacillus sp. ALC3]
MLRSEVATLPVSLLVAFTAGIVSAFNPCGVGLLPSYLVYLMSGRSEESRWKWYFGTASGALMTIGFMMVFGTAGLLIGVVGQLLFKVVPFISFVVSAGLFVAAWFMWRGSLSDRLSFGGVSSRIETVFRRGSSPSFIAYGVSYGLISMTCSLPVFLAVVAEGLGRSAQGTAMLFASYTVGMGLVITILSTLATLANSFLRRFIRTALPMVHRLSAIVMAASGVYLVWYWVWGPGLHTVFLS